MEKKRNIFIMGGRTGGPLLPAMAIAKNLDEYTPIIVGVKNAFEERYAIAESINFLDLPEAKLTIASFSNLSLVENVKELLSMILMLFKLFYSIIVSIFYLIKFKPRGIISSGSFIGVPVSVAMVFTNFLRITQTKLIVHQQDAKPSLSNKIIARFADIITAFFPETAKLLSIKAEVIPNPIDFEKYSNLELEKITLDDELLRITVKRDKPLLLIFGGGSGAFAINKWVFENLELLKNNFNILHLTGVLQESTILKIPNSESYVSKVFLSKEMAKIMVRADLVMCRAGMASITELIYLKKKAFLIPIPHSHQEDNALFVEKYFPTLKQRYSVAKPGKEEWLSIIKTFYPKFYQSIIYPDQVKQKEEFDIYINSLKNLLS